MFNYYLWKIYILEAFPSISHNSIYVPEQCILKTSFKHHTCAFKKQSWLYKIVKHVTAKRYLLS